MKILFDLSFVRYNLYAGVSKYAYRILDYIVASGRSDRYILILNIVSESQIKEWYPQFSYIVIGHKRLLRYPILRTFYLSYDFRRKVNKSEGSVMFCPWGNEITCLKTKAKKISTIHDLQFLIDLKGGKRFVYKFIADRVVANSDQIVTISEFSKKQILSFYPECKDRIVSLGNSVQLYPDIRNRLINENYLLYVGRMSPMKNVYTLLKAFCLVRKKIDNRILVLVGKKNEYWYKILLPFIRENALDTQVKVIENCSEEDLTNYYKYADLFIFPSLREGFGSPPVEAAFSKVPVLTSLADSLEEVTKGLLYSVQNPLDENEYANNIMEILRNPPTAEQLEIIAEEFDNSYSIDKVGQRICDYLENALWER